MSNSNQQDKVVVLVCPAKMAQEKKKKLEKEFKKFLETWEEDKD